MPILLWINRPISPRAEPFIVPAPTIRCLVYLHQRLVRRSQGRDPGHTGIRGWPGSARGEVYTTKMSLRQLRAYIDQRFFQQRRQAKQRGVEWQLDYWRWLEIWQTSGHLHERGRQKGQWQMCRLADIGPYASSNVRIDRMEINASEAQITKNRIRLARQKAACAAAGTAGITTAPST